MQTKDTYFNRKFNSDPLSLLCIYSCADSYAVLQDAMDALPKTRSSCDLEPTYDAAEPTEDSCLVLDFIKLAAATAAASNAASKRGNQNPSNAAVAGINESQQGCTSLDAKPSPLNHYINPAQQQILNLAVLPAVQTENGSDSPILRRSMMPDGPRQQNFVSGTRTASRRQWSSPPRQDAVGIRRLSSDSVISGSKAKLLLQDLECGQSGGDLVQVRVAQHARRDLWTEAHQSDRRMGRGKMHEGPFGRTWAGRRGGLLAEVLLEGPHGDAQ